MGKKVWTEEEISIVKQHFNRLKPGESCRYISSKILPHRTAKAISNIACKHNLVRETSRRRWRDDEILYLRKLAENKPIPVIYSGMQYWWKRYAVTPRTIGAVRSQLLNMGYTADNTSYLSVPEICGGLQCCVNVVYRWLKTPEFKKLLNPVRSDVDKARYLISLHNFRKFASEYPAEIAATCPDITWLVSVLTSEG